MSIRILEVVLNLLAQPNISKTFFEAAANFLNPNPVGIFFYGPLTPKCESNVNKVLLNLQNNSFIIFDTSFNYTKLKHPFVQIAQTSILVGCGEDDDVNEIVEKWRENALLNARGKVFVISNGSEKKTRDWLKALWDRSRAINTAVMTSQGTFYTWFAYKPVECTNVTTLTKLDLKNLFPPRHFSDIKGCALNATTRAMAPYVIEPKVENVFTDGVEVYALFMMMEKLKGVLNFVDLPTTEILLATLSPTGQIIGGAKLLREYRTDIIFGQLKMSFEYQILTDMLYPHNEDDLVWWVPQPKFISSVHNLYLVFNQTIWLIILLVFISISILLYLNLEKSLSLSMLTALSATLNIGMKLPKNNTLKVFSVISLLVYGMNISTAYQASLINLLSKQPTEGKVKTALEGLEKGLHMQLFQTHLVFIKSNDSALWQKMVKTKQFTAGRRVFFENYVNSGGYMFLQAKSFFLKKIADEKLYDEYNRPFMEFLPDRQVALMSMFCMSVGHPLRDELNRILLYIVEAGFTKLWLVNYINKITTPDSAEIGAITFENVSGAFYILITVHCISIVTFIFEWIFRKFH